MVTGVGLPFNTVTIFTEAGACNRALPNDKTGGMNLELIDCGQKQDAPYEKAGGKQQRSERKRPHWHIYTAYVN